MPAEKETNLTKKADEAIPEKVDVYGSPGEWMIGRTDNIVDGEKHGRIQGDRS